MSDILRRLLAEPSLAEQYGPMSLADVPQRLGASTAPGWSGDTSHWENVGMRMAERRGYTPAELQKLDYIVEHESGWDPGAVNESSGAWGIPQIYPAAHPDAPLNSLTPHQQIDWLLDYIQSRYGGINNAYQYKQQHGTY
jgi:Transglycosylase SLT domain